MSTITKEQAKDLRDAFQCWQQDYDPVEDKEQYDMFGLGMVAMDALLASLEAEAVAWRSLYYENHGLLTGSKNVLASWQKQGWKCEPLYTAPPAPVSVPDEMSTDIVIDDHPKLWAYANGWNACRSAMLQGAEPVTTAYKLPMQPLVIDAHGTLRFKENPIVRALLDYATEHGYGLNEIALEEFDAEDQMQLAQLIGYSLSGYGTLSYVTDESYERAAAAAPQQEVK
ncbi:hypothetical protein [Enterobacter chuandaensis]|uniref:hypothetical protein n=1 Tax=Enterobacter chuandaensis TaxID=2497875 RepID=UPI00223738C4|nr:hypothetical protein [Enterobacter chuandaensis]MCW4780928.1 hypothetical protein [Enterobacter chuandaensis]MDA4758780.1 hypothetical protein [Enterobacter chuandaensis]